jgi:hypothetical protein
MIKVYSSLIVLTCLALAATSTAVAAPAPFPRPAHTPDGPPSMERLKQILLTQHNIHADSISASRHHVTRSAVNLLKESTSRADEAPPGRDNQWIIVGNTPMAHDGRLMYSQKMYLVTFTSYDRRGTPQITIREVTPARFVITR